MPQLRSLIKISRLGGGRQFTKDSDLVLTIPKITL
jgi:hypothetical protein